MTTNVLKSFAKINLALHVTGKLTNLHKIESIVKFIDLYDTISINEINKHKHKVSFIGNFSKKIKKDNTVNKLFENLEKKNFFKPKEKKPIMLENIKNIFYKMELSSKETRILTSVFAQLKKTRI